MSKETMEEQFNKKFNFYVDKTTTIEVKQFIRTIRLKDKEELKKKVGMLRQWLNEDRITDTNKMISTEDLLHWLN